MTPKVLAGRTVSGPISARMRIDGREYLNFFGAGYLALSAVPEIRNAVLRVLQEGVPLAQHLPAAHGAIDPIFDAIEQAGALVSGTEASVYFPSGYLIGTVGLASLAPSFDLVVLDESAHFNLQDAAKLSGRPTFKFVHCDVDSLSSVLKQQVQAKQRPLVVTDGAFATTGRIPPLADYAAVLAPYDGRMFVDESHAFGVVGEKGRGAAEYCGVESITTIGATYSKAYCAFGAMVTCSKSTALRLRTTPPTNAANAGSPLLATAAAASLAYVSERPELRRNLSAMTDRLRMCLRPDGFGRD